MPAAHGQSRATVAQVSGNTASRLGATPGGRRQRRSETGAPLRSDEPEGQRNDQIESGDRRADAGTQRHTSGDFEGDDGPPMGTRPFFQHGADR